MLTWNHPWVWSYLPPPGHSHPSEEKRKIGTFVKSKNIHQLLLSKHIYQLFVKLVKFDHINSQLVTSIAAFNIATESKDINVTEECKNNSPLHLLLIRWYFCSKCLKKIFKHFILLVWSASYILLTSEPAHCLTLHCSVCSIVDNCWLLPSRCCTRTRVKLLIAIVPLTW